ncbi:hypothetical protein OHT57_44620 [Streptomyces sp. NBC_00285]|uniref:hypothetical protein n=1 Tax=Streptomyces sp. NBC_00285 TaxID=2975700 RepID=UPI002E29581A|nr:hypothetical protein [Streptomyces sp. NBC_00285]
MARFTHSVPRTRGPGAAAVWVVLLAVLITLLGPCVPGGEPSGVRGGAVVVADSVHGESYADNADPAVSAAAVRSHRDAAGERHAPPVSAPGASPATGTAPLPPARSPVAAAGPPVPEPPAHRHGVRAPPLSSGI